MTTVTASSRTERDSASTQYKNLVFFVSADPADDPGPLRTARHFATVAAGAGLPAEIRLAARAVSGIDAIGAAPQGVDVTVCPRAMELYGVRDEQVDAIGGRSRTLAEILTDVAAGDAVLIPVTHSIDESKES